MLFPDTVPRETIKTVQQVNLILPDSTTRASMQYTMMCVGV
jgi:hypothetical protein